MPDDATAQLQILIDRLNQGDTTARRQLLECAHDRMRRLAAAVLQRSFPALRNRHDVDSVLHDTWLRLIPALEKSQPPTVADFFRLVAHKIRQVLLDLAERQQRLGRLEAPGGDGSHDPLSVAGGNTYDPARLALWTEFHRKVDTLADEERAVFELHYYAGLPQVEIARLLNLHPRKVSYLWVAATEKLADGLGPSVF
jgi:RNA polymerase sigma factor (sigma-70 family)